MTEHFFRRRKSEIERRTAALLRLDPDAASVAFHNTLAYGKAYAGTGNLSTVQPLEYPKNHLVVLRFNTDAIIRNRYAPLTVLHRCRDMNAKRLLTSVLDSIRDQILKEPDKVGLVAGKRWECIARDRCPTIFNSRMTALQRLAESRIQIYIRDGCLPLIAD